VTDSTLATSFYDPEIKINYASTDDGGCLEKSFCNTPSYSSSSTQSCLYTVQDSDNDTLHYSVRVCDDAGGCSVARTGTFNINHIPEMNGVYIGSDSSNYTIGNDNNLMCMHLGADDELVARSDFVLDADANWTIFGDVRNRIDTGLSNGASIEPFNYSIVAGGFNLTFDSTVYEDDVNLSNYTYEPNFDALVIDINNNSVYDNQTDIVLYNPFNSLREGDTLNASLNNTLSFYDRDNSGDYNYSMNNPEDIIYNVNGIIC
jgi:hypothetical protein